MPHRGLGLGSLDPLPENFSGSSLDVMLYYIDTSATENYVTHEP